MLKYMYFFSSYIFFIFLFSADYVFEFEAAVLIEILIKIVMKIQSVV